MTALQPILNLIDANTPHENTQADAASYFTDERAYLAGLLGSDGTLATARKTLLVPGASGTILTSNGAASDPTWQAVSTGVGDCRVYAYKSGSVANVTGSSLYTIPFDAEIYDIGNDFNTSTGVFTVPFTGMYAVTLGVSLTQLTADTKVEYSGVGSTSSFFLFDNDNFLYKAANTGKHRIVSVVTHLTASETVVFKVQAFDIGGDTVDLSGSNQYQTYVKILSLLAV